MATVGVLSARARVEEKALMAALANAGVVSALFPPADEPLPVGALPVAPDAHPFPAPQIVVDRHPDRHVARAVLATCAALRVPALCAGLAATGDRLDVASALTAAGLPRPSTALCASPEAALQAVAAMGLPATLLPLELQMAPVALLDVDTAEAVLEHRAVLGGPSGALALLQSGAPVATDLASVVIVDGVAVALSLASGAAIPAEALRLAEAAARVLRIELGADVIALGAAGPVVWDVQPVPEFRHALPIAGRSVAQAIAAAAAARLELPVTPGLAYAPDGAWLNLGREEVEGDVTISA
jgi:hypothetical protein